MAYLNLELDYFEHPKTQRLTSLLGNGAAMLPIKLWAHAGKYHAKTGEFSTYSSKEIEIAAGWWGKSGVMTAAMTRAGFLERKENGYSIHDWASHQGHIFAIKERNRKIALKRWKTIEGGVLENSPSEASTR